MKDLFSGLNIFGFDKVEELPVFKAQSAAQAAKAAAPVNVEAKPITAADCLFDKSYTCPVCGKAFKEKSIKSSKVKFMGTDVDLMPIYTPVSPFLYNVVLCSTCGYAALTENFLKITDRQCDIIKKNISIKFKPKKYDVPFSEQDAIERLKLALLNTMVKKGRAGERAYICLVISWIYKQLNDAENRMMFVISAHEEFSQAYQNDTFPIYGMDEYVASYLLGELSRMLGEYDSASKWASIVLSSRLTSARVKDMALGLKERIKSDKAANRSGTAEKPEAANRSGTAEKPESANRSGTAEKPEAAE